MPFPIEEQASSIGALSGDEPKGTSIHEESMMLTQQIRQSGGVAAQTNLQADAQAIEKEQQSPSILSRLNSNLGLFAFSVAATTVVVATIARNNRSRQLK